MSSLHALVNAPYPDCPSAGYEWLRFGRLLESDTTATIEAAKPAHSLNPYCLSDDDYGKFKRHHSALAFWEEAKAAGLELDTTHVHLHPGRFIETFRKCGWLSESELTQMLPTSIMREASHDQWVSDPVDADRSSTGNHSKEPHRTQQVSYSAKRKKMRPQRGAFFFRLRRIAQYCGTLESTSRDHASMPPSTLLTSVKPWAAKRSAMPRLEMPW